MSSACLRVCRRLPLIDQLLDARGFAHLTRANDNLD
jgi:hypothetical protein